MTAEKRVVSCHINRVEQAWEDWLKAMSPEDRERLRAQGITGPDHSTEVHKASDLLWKADQVETPDEIGTIDLDQVRNQVEEMVEVVGINPLIEIMLEHKPAIVAEEIQSAFRMFICEFFGKNNPQLELVCLARAIGLPMPEMDTVREIGKHFGVSYQNVQGKEKKWRQILNLPRVAHQKSAEASESYRLRNRRQTKLKPSISNG